MIDRTSSILKHMLEDAQDIQRFAKEIDNFESFIANTLYRKAIILSILNIGELTKHLPQEFRSEHNEIKWKEIAGMRNIAAHEYRMINDRVVWQTVMNSIPELVSFLQEQLK